MRFDTPVQTVASAVMHHEVRQEIRALTSVFGTPPRSPYFFHITSLPKLISLVSAIFRQSSTRCDQGSIIVPMKDTDALLHV